MLKRATTITSLLLILILLLVVYVVVTPSHSKELYIKDIATQKMQTLQQKTPIQQKYKVSKDLWIHDPEMGRLHHHITSLHSTLTAHTIDKSMHFMEQMLSIQCCFQEKIESKDGTLVQQVRYIEAPKGKYQYFDHHFDAQSAFFALLHLPKNHFITELDLDSALLTGMAKELSFYVLGDKTYFQSQRCKLHIHKPFLSSN